MGKYAEAAEVYGGIRPAARRHGLAESTFRGRILAEADGKEVPPLVEPSGNITTQKEPDRQAQVKELERLVELQQERIERLTKSNYKIPTSIGPRAGKSHCRVIIPDTHGCFADEQAMSAFLYDLEKLSANVREIVMLGDHIDCGGFLAQHHTWGYVAEADYCYEDDVNATNQLLDKLQGACKNATIHYLEGNHERRVERWCLTQALSSQRNAEYLLKLFGISEQLHIEKRGIQLYRQGKFYHGLPIPATIKLGRCHFTHGNRTGSNPAKAMLSDFGGNVVFGHVHRMDSYSARTVSEGVIGAWSVGCLCRLQPLWQHTQITGWSHCYGLQFVQDDGDFLHVSVPIIDGKSYMIPLAGQAAA